MARNFPYPSRGLLDFNWNSTEDDEEDEHEQQVEEPLRLADAQTSYMRFRENLTEILREQAWKKRGYPNLKAFCKATMPDIDYSTVIRHKRALEAHERLEPEVEYGVLPEYVYREVLKAEEADQAKVWALAKQLAGSLKKLRPCHIQEAREQLRTRDPGISKAGMPYDEAVDFLTNATLKAVGSSGCVSDKTLRDIWEQVIYKFRDHLSRCGNSAES